jgi:uncharacterized protein YbjT (DUF2867 family)
LNNKTALLIGATGLIGSELLKTLLNCKEYTKVIVLGRKSLVIDHLKLEEKIIDFNQLHSLRIDSQIDDVFSCLGTTIKKAKTQQAMRKIDVEIPLQVAKLTKALGAKHFLFVSALNANSQSAIFYSRMKGELEDEVKTIGFPSVSIFRPSLLLGKRQEFRLGEKLAEIFFYVFPFIFAGPLKKYKAIKAQTIAAAMLNAAQLHYAGVYVYPSDHIEKLGQISD